MAVNKTQEKEEVMNERSRIVLAFAFNLLLPGLGFHYPRTRHNVGWLRRLGFVTIVVFAFAFPIDVAILSINHRFALQELATYLTFVLVSAFLGAGAEQKASRSFKPCAR